MSKFIYITGSDALSTWLKERNIVLHDPPIHKVKSESTYAWKIYHKGETIEIFKKQKEGYELTPTNIIIHQVM